MAHTHIAILPILLILLTFGNTINAGITRQLDNILPIRERITRSVGFDVEEDSKNLETISTEDTTYSKHRHLDRPARSIPEDENQSKIRLARATTNADDLQTSEDSIVFKPLFRRRNNHKRLRRETPADDMQTAENNIVFRPLFRKRQNIRRFRREAPTDDMQTAENNIVFRPLFRKRQNSRRFRRDAADDMQTAENNIVFRPLFRRKPIRRVRSVESDYSGTAFDENVPETQQDNIRLSSSISDDSDYEYPPTDDENTDEIRVRRDTNEVMDTAANTIVFRPLFRNNRRNFNRRGNNN